MKIISLNVWGGKISEPLTAFIKAHSSHVDVFCFQEVLKGGKGKTAREEMKDCYERVGNLLPSHTGYFSEYGEGGYYGESLKGMDFNYGVACFVRNDLPHSFVGSATLYDLETKWNDYDGGFAAGASLAVNVSNHTIVNVHGLWQGSMKKDSEARFEQSKRILNLANTGSGKKIICGDFNLEPDTKSIGMIENLPMRNLIKEYGIKSTRSSHYKKELRFADYMLVSPDLHVLDFEVLPDEVSDHLPLYLNIEDTGAPELRLLPV
jgi:endonuclease/exonuclease/phosphatase family metal-dependent hydrolase